MCVGTTEHNFVVVEGVVFVHGQRTLGAPRGRRRRRHRGEEGASAVEFALVSLILFPVLLGIIDYGLWFNDSLNTRQGVREAARLGVVQTFECPTGANDLGRMQCVVRREVGSVSGPTFVRVEAPDGWERGNPLVVCAMVRTDAVTGFVPLPNDRIIRSKTQMSIEVESPVPNGFNATAPSSIQDAAPAGTDWSWCT